MNCREFHELCAAHALDALSPSERAAAHEHLACQVSHEGCTILLSRYQSVTSALFLALPASKVPPRLWPRVEQELAAPPARARSPRAREALAYVLAAAALVALAFVRRGEERAARELEHSAQREQRLTAHVHELDARSLACETRVLELMRTQALQREAVALMGRATTKVVPLASLSPTFKGANALIDGERARVLVVATDVPRLPGKDFELWTVRGTGAPEPAGFLEVLEHGAAVGEIAPERLAGGLPDAFAISLEPTGGRPVPTEVVAMGKLPG